MDDCSILEEAVLLEPTDTRIIERLTNRWEIETRQGHSPRKRWREGKR